MKKNIRLIKDGECYRFKYQEQERRITTRGFKTLKDLTQVFKEERFLEELNVEDKVIPLSEKIGDVKVFPHHEVLMVGDVKEAVNNLIQEIKSNDYNILKPKTIELFKKHFGDLVE